MYAAAGMVLFVEDDCLLHTLVESALADAGFTSASAVTAEEACLMLRQGDGRLCALVTDVNLGSALTGWDVARLARDLRPGMPVVYATGGSERDFAACSVAGSILVAKPYHPEQIPAAVSSLLAVIGAAASAAASGRRG